MGNGMVAESQGRNLGAGDRGDKLTICGLGKHFPVNGDRLVALDDIDLSVASGEFVVLAGRSGCGKTTLLRVVMGLESPSQGWIEVDGERVHRPGQDRAMVFQQAQLLPWRSALRNVTYGLEIQGLTAQERRERAEHYLDLVGLKPHLDLRPMQMSGGMQQRVGLARALAVEPEVLLMDEPFGALDAQTRETLQASLLEIHERTRKTTVFVTHDIDEAVMLADRVVVMSPSPGRVKEIVDVGLPRPRPPLSEMRLTKEFVEKRHYVWQSLHEDADS